MTNRFAVTGVLPLAPAQGARTAARPSIARVEVLADAATARGVWSELETLAPVSAYQTQAWLVPWLETIGAAQNIRPLFSVAFDAAGAAIGLLPLCVMNRGPLRLAEFPGVKDANFTFGLIRPGAHFTAGDLTHWLRETARLSRERIDLFALVNQPESWNDAPNPLRALGGQPSPAQGFRTALLANAEAFVKTKTSGDARKKLRAKERHLKQLGEIAYVTARDAPTAQRILRAFHVQKAQRMKDMGVANVFADPAAEIFLERCALDFNARGRGGLELHALTLNDQVVATYGGAAHQGRFSAMFNSIELDPKITRCSPGDLLLSCLIQEKCRAGLHTFDLGVGAARYKETWCDTPEPLFDVYMPVNALGWAMYAVKSGKRRLKRRIKETPAVWRLIGRLRKARR